MNPNSRTLEVEQALAQRAETIGSIRFTDLGRIGIRMEFGKPNCDGEYPACVIPNQIPDALRAMGRPELLRALRWLGLERLGGMAVDLDGPTLGESILAAARKLSGKNRGVQNWLVLKTGLRSMQISRYCNGVIPGPEVAEKIRVVLGWSAEHMETLLRAARLRRLMEKGRKT